MRDDCLNCGMCESCIDRSIAAAEEAEANARLISAAPDLLLALKGLMAVQDCATDCWCIEVDTGSCEACQARAAIAKAEWR